MAAPTLLKDKVHRKMWRIKWEDNTISDMCNLSWAKEHIRRHLETKRRQLNDQKD